MIKWTRLQLNKLPVIAIEADSAIQKLEELVQKVSQYAYQEDIENLNNLRGAIINRIEALDRFYEQNYLDSTISIFHMIKLKLKKAIFKIPNIYNETIQIQMLTPDHHSNHRQQDTFSKFNDQSFKKFSQNPKMQFQGKGSNFKIEKKSKSKSKSKLKSKDNIMRLLETSRRDQEETNLMEDVDFREMHYFDNSFDFNRRDQPQPLFQTHQGGHSAIDHKGKDKPKPINTNIKVGDKKDKSLSPFAKKQPKNQPQTNENAKTLTPKVKTPTNNAQQKSKFLPRPNYSISNNANNSKLNSGRTNSKLGTETKTAGKDLSKKLKTEGTQIREEEEKINEDGQFRFTIKMTKQQYLSLLKMKELIKNGKIP